MLKALLSMPKINTLAYNIVTMPLRQDTSPSLLMITIQMKITWPNESGCN